MATTKFSRSASIAVDQYGIDPLMDNVLNQLYRITAYSMYKVKIEERCAPDLISYNVYGTVDFWWHIMGYNGIAFYKDFVEGLVIKIPDKGALITLVSEIDIPRQDRPSAKNIIRI